MLSNDPWVSASNLRSSCLLTSTVIVLLASFEYYVGCLMHDIIVSVTGSGGRAGYAVIHGLLVRNRILAPPVYQIIKNAHLLFSLLILLLPAYIVLFVQIVLITCRLLCAAL